MRLESASQVMDNRLVRMVLRVPPDFERRLLDLHERLFEETRSEYSNAAIVRGLISLGFASLADKASIAGEFDGARVKRGRRRSDDWVSTGDGEVEPGSKSE